MGEGARTKAARRASDVSDRAVEALKRMKRPATRPAALQHQHFDADPHALRDLGALLDYAEKHQATGEAENLQALTKALRLCCRAATPQEAHRWLRAAVSDAKGFEYGDLARHALTFLVNEKKPKRAPDRLQRELIRLIKQARKPMTAAELWNLVTADPPHGITFISSGKRPWLEWGPQRHEQCTFRPFSNRVTEARKTVNASKNS